MNTDLYQLDIALNVEAFELWIEYRKSIKKPFKSAMTIEGQQNKLIKLSGGDLVKQAMIVRQSIDEGWTGLFELKQQEAKKKPDGKQSLQSLYDNVRF